MSLERLEALLATVESDELKADLLKVYQEGVEAEKQTGISKYNKKDSELLKLKGAVKETGYDPEKHGTLKEYTESLKAVIDEGQKSSLELQSLRGELDKLKGDLERKDSEALDATKFAELTSLIGKKYKRSELIIDKLMRDPNLEIEGKKLYYKDGEDTVEFSAYDKTKLESEYDDLLIVKQQGGDGGSSGEADEMPDALFEKLKKEMLS
jgi:hypothetical protein